MGKGRLEAFSDGVIAVIITIMVLELHAPRGGDLSAILPLGHSIISYVLSFIFLGIYWNNHHHLMQAAQKVNGPILWANLHLLFWLSLVPFVTAWMGENGFASLPVALYGVVMLFAGTAYYILERLLIAYHGKKSTLATVLGDDFKGKISLAFYLAAIPFAFVISWISFGLYILVAVMWLIPDRRIERAFEK